MDELGDLVGENLLGFVDLAVLERTQTTNLVHRQEGQQTEALFDVLIVNIAPVLVEVVRAGLRRIEPKCALLGLAHFTTVMGQQQLEGAGKRIFTLLAADEIRAAQHVAPLVVAAHLQTAAVVLEQLEEVVGLHEHVGELEEGKSVFGCHACFIAVGSQHFVDGEHGADVAHELDEVQVAQPVAVVDDNRLALGKIEEAAHLLFNLRNVVVDGFNGHHLAHIGLSGRVANHRGAAAHQRNRTVSRTLHVRHRHDWDVVTDVQGIGGRVEADVEGGRILELFVKLIFKRHLGDKAALLEQVENVLCHGVSPPSIKRTAKWGGKAALSK